MITEIPSFMQVTAAANPEDAVRILKSVALKDSYPAYIVTSARAYPAAAFNIEASCGDFITQVADNLANAGIGSFDYISYPFCGQGAHCFFAVLNGGIYEWAARLPLMLCRLEGIIAKVGLLERREDLCYAVSVLPPESETDFSLWQKSAARLCSELDCLTLDFLEVGWVKYPR